MRTDTRNITIVKASGVRVPFDQQKLTQSLHRAGADREQADEIAERVAGMLVDNISTKKIYGEAFRLLKNMSRPVAARYKLKHAIMELGPSGFLFEQFVGELMKDKGYQITIGAIVKGHCVNHEIDVIAEKGDQHLMIECKYHNRQGYICNVKIPLYIQSRFLDVEMQWKQIDGHAGKFHQGWVITNTRFSADAANYGRCMNLNLVGWDYPKNGGLKDWIDDSGLHPITCLTMLSAKEKQDLLNRKIVLCRNVHNNYAILEEIGVRPPRLQKVLDECAVLCETSKNSTNQRDGHEQLKHQN